MQRLLEDLYNGRINPLDLKLKDGGRYKEISEKVSFCDENFSKLLSVQQKEMFKKYISKQGELFYLNSEERFIQGFKMGARFVIEIICDEDGKLTEKKS